MFLMPILALTLLGSEVDSSLREIRRLYGEVQDQLSRGRCLVGPTGEAQVRLCPGGGVVTASSKTDSSLLVTEWRMDTDSAMFAMVRETLPGKRIRETRIYRTPAGPHSLTRSGPATAIQGMAQTPIEDTALAKELLASGNLAWKQAGISNLAFPFASMTIRGHVIVEEEASIEAKVDPEVDAVSATWRLKPSQLDPWLRQFLNKRFCKIGTGTCATATGFILLSTRTPHFVELEADPPLPEEKLLERHTSAMPPALVLELSSPLDGPVALENFEPLIPSAALPETFRTRTRNLVKRENRKLDRKWREYLAANIEEGDPPVDSSSSWSSSPGYQVQEATASLGGMSLYLFGAWTGEICTSEGFFESVSLGYATSSRPIKTAGSPHHPGSSNRRSELVEIPYPEDDPNGLTLGPIFVPWNRRHLQLFAEGPLNSQWIKELDDSLRWSIIQHLSIPFQDCGC